MDVDSEEDSEVRSYPDTLVWGLDPLFSVCAMLFSKIYSYFDEVFQKNVHFFDSQQSGDENSPYGWFIM
jgi:hypothetical protein